MVAILEASRASLLINGVGRIGALPQKPMHPTRIQFEFWPVALLSLPPLQHSLCACEILQVVDVDGVPGRHDEPDLVVVEARVERDLVRVVDADRAVHTVDRRRLTAPLTPGNSAWRMPSPSIVHMWMECSVTGVTATSEDLPFRANTNFSGILPSARKRGQNR